MSPTANLDAPDVSVIVPFRNRETRRLDRAIESLWGAGEGLNVEVIVSDFGSDDALGVAGLCARHGVRHIYTESHRWSRAECLNRGIDAARGRLIVADDADMIWAPGSLTKHAERMLASPHHILNYQVWDLPASLTDELLSHADFTWEYLRGQATSHSRWGHGLLLMPAEAVRRIRGYDERMHTYGVEDLDLTQRLRRMGYSQHWAGHAADEIFHIWHPTSNKLAKTDPVLKPIVDKNRSYYRSDSSIIRNLTTGKRPSPETGASPLVTVAISTCNRAPFLREAIRSVQMQTFQDFEIVIVDDGSTDETRSVVAAFADPRIIYIHQESAGISAARNLALENSRGYYTAVLDDDDLMIRDRLEIQLRQMTKGIQGVVGNFVNFEHSTGALRTWADHDPTLDGAYETGGFAGHPTWLIETNILRSLRYDETLASAVDNSMALRALRSGVVFAHCNQVVTVRRMHSEQVTSVGGQGQKTGAALMHSWLTSSVELSDREGYLKEHRVPKTNSRSGALEEVRILSSFPDHLVTRDVRVSTSDPSLAAQLSNAGWAADKLIVSRNGLVHSATADISDASQSMIAGLALEGFAVEVTAASRRPISSSDEPASVFSLEQTLTDETTDSEAVLESDRERLDSLLKTARAETLSSLSPSQVLVEERFSVPSDEAGGDGTAIHWRFLSGSAEAAVDHHIVEVSDLWPVLLGRTGPYTVESANGPVSPELISKIVRSGIETRKENAS